MFYPKVKLEMVEKGNTWKQEINGHTLKLLLDTETAWRIVTGSSMGGNSHYRLIIDYC